jgi:hypothetical protein
VRLQLIAIKASLLLPSFSLHIMKKETDRIVTDLRFESRKGLPVPNE